MSKRVHEIAKELGLNSKEVIGRLKDAGVEVKSHSSSVEDLVYERVFGSGDAAETNGAANGRSAPHATAAPEGRAVKPPSAPVEDRVYGRVFGAGDAAETNGAANGRSAAQETEAQEAREAAEKSGPGAPIQEAPVEKPGSDEEAGR